jgi:hypothetical protein
MMMPEPEPEPQRLGLAVAAAEDDEALKKKQAKARNKKKRYKANQARAAATGAAAAAATAAAAMAACSAQETNPAAAMESLLMAGGLGALVVVKTQVHSVVTLLQESGWYPARYRVPPHQRRAVQLLPAEPEMRVVPIVEPGTTVLNNWLQRSLDEGGESVGGPANRVESAPPVIPAALLALLSSGAAQWRPGLRLSAANKYAPTVFASRSAHGRDIVPPPAGSGLPSQLCAPCRGGFRFRYVELFAGIGGFRLGLDAVGGECVYASEIEPAARAVYSDNFGAPPAGGDICTVSMDDIPAFDLLTGGFPCQPFSTLGKQPGLEDEKGQLFRQIIRVLDHHRPRAFLLENVPGLLSSNKGAAFDTILDALRSAGGEGGYRVSHQLLKSRALTAQCAPLHHLHSASSRHSSPHHPRPI